MKWVVAESEGEVAERAAATFLRALEHNPSIVLGLPTGRTPEGMYARIVEECRTEYRCFSGVTTFNLDEYAGIRGDHPGSYRAYMRSRLFDHVDVDPSRIHIPDGSAPDLDEECAAYERAIAGAGGLELTFLGLGTNGHIGFNEPGSPFDSRTRVVQLTESTRRANAPHFPAGDVPEKAITMGIATITASRAIVVLATGAKKAEVIRRLRAAEVTEGLPASALLGHPDVTVIVDRAAAGD